MHRPCDVMERRWTKLGSKIPIPLRKGRPLDTNVSALFPPCHSSQITLASPCLQGCVCFRCGVCLSVLPSTHYRTWVQGGGVHTTKVGACVLSRLSPVSFRPVDCSPRSSPVHGILQARVLEWVVVPSPRGSSPPRGRTCVSYASALAPPGKPLQLKPYTKCNSAICCFFTQFLRYFICNTLESRH